MADHPAKEKWRHKGAPRTAPPNLPKHGLWCKRNRGNEIPFSLSTEILAISSFMLLGGNYLPENNT